MIPERNPQVWREGASGYQCVFGFLLWLWVAGFKDRSRQVLLAPLKRAAAPAVPDEDAAAEARRLRATGSWLAAAV